MLFYECGYLGRYLAVFWFQRWWRLLNLMLEMDTEIELKYILAGTGIIVKCEENDLERMH